MVASAGAGKRPAMTMMRGAPGPVAAAAILILAGFSGLGCGRRVLRSADVGVGDYYTRDEYRHLSQEQREEYCAELAEEAGIQNDRRASAETKKAEAALQIRSASDRSREIETEIRAIQQAPALPGTTTPAAAAPTGSYTVRRGDSLWKIAARFLGDGRKWKEIFDANHDRLHQAGLLPVGTVLKIPGTAARADSGKGGS